MQKRHLRHLTLFSALASSVLLVLTGCSPGKSGSSELGKAITNKLTAIREAGYPTSLQELNTWHQELPAEQNAAVDLEAAFAKVVYSDEAKLKLPPRATKLDERLKANILGVMQLNQAARDKLHQAISTKAARYPGDWSKPTASERGHLRRLRTATQIMRLESAVALDNNRPDLALLSVQTVLTMARSLEAEPDTISQLIRFAVLESANLMVERILSQRALTDTQLSGLQTAYRNAEPAEGVTRALAGERCLWLFVYLGDPIEAGSYMQSAGGETFDAAGVLKFGAYKGPQQQKDCLFSLDAMEQLIQASKQEYPQALETAREAQTKLEQAAAGPPKERPVIACAVLPPLIKVFDRAAAHVARARVMQAGLAVERYRLAHAGQLPPSLSAVAPATIASVPVDPFDGQPLRYKRLPKGYTVYSLGPDRQDNQGKEKQGSSDAGYDVTFVVER